MQEFENEQFARRLHKAMLDKSMSQSDLARAPCGASRPTSAATRARRTYAQFAPRWLAESVNARWA